MRTAPAVHSSGWTCSPMLLRDLAPTLPGTTVVGNDAVDVRRVVLDSRVVGPGDLFVALPGLSHDGTRFVEAAFAAGAVACAVERVEAIPEGRSGVVVPSARRALGEFAAALEGWPSRRLRAVGVTGTDGKTTTTNLVGSIRRAAG